jgi:NAD-dependent SIR2 family protein deacetylase
MRNSADENGNRPNPEGGCDLMIVIGTALTVNPFASTVKYKCPKVLINLENTDKAGFDFENKKKHPRRLFLKGKCDLIVRKLVKDIGWEDDMKKLCP